MTDPALQRSYIQAMAKHLPPSAASLRLLDVGGMAGGILSESRADLDVVRADVPTLKQFPADSFDAVVAYDYQPRGDFLRATLNTLRPGGRLIIVQPAAPPHEGWVTLLEEVGYTRILVEAALESPGLGVLMRGEKPHTEARTVDRIQQVAGRDAPRAGRYVYLLIRQTPNKPVWSLAPDDLIEWQAVAVEGHDEVVLLAFSSLPKAVAFMQPAVVEGRIQDINKVAKFNWTVAKAWDNPLMLNPTDDILETNTIVMLPVDPHSAEAPDE